MYRAFDVADQYRTPVMILADGMLGQMMEPVILPEPKEVKDAADKPWAATGTGLAREHNIVTSLYLDPAELERYNIARFERYEVIKANEQRFEAYQTEDAEIVLVAFGASSRIARSAVMKARAAGIKAGMIRPITLWPFPVDGLRETLKTAKAYLSVEMNMGQMIEDVRLALRDEAPVEFYGRTPIPRRP